jgi:predicted Zn-dependent peptidase
MTKIFRLPNGITCVCEERPNTGTVAMRITIKQGSQDESDDENGLTNLAQESCWAGSQTRTMEQIAYAFESVGASNSSDTTSGDTWFAAYGLSRNAGEVFQTLADAILNPAFKPAKIDITRNLITQGLIRSSQSAAGIAGREFTKTAFRGYSIASPNHGTVDLVNSFTPAQIRAKHAELLSRPDNIIISFAGDIEAETAHQLALTHFSGLQAFAAPLPEVAADFTGGDVRIENTNDQLNLFFGFPAPSAHDTRRYAFMMFNELLSGGMSSPLFQEIREKRGLVYSVKANYASTQSTGTFYISAGTGKGNARELLTVALDLLTDTAKNGFSQQDIDRVRERIIRGNRTAQESIEGVCNRNSNHLQTRGRIIPLEETEAMLAQVTPEDIKAACASLLQSGKYALAGVGPQDGMPTSQELKDMIAERAATLPVMAVTPISQVSPQAVAFAQAGHAPEPVTTGPQMSVLGNGMIVVTDERPGSVSCGAWVGAGSDHETPALNGATHMNEHMMFKGTPSYGPGQIDRIIESELGGGLNAYTSRDKTAYYFYNLLAKDIEKVVDICGEMVFQANLDHEEFDGKTVAGPDGVSAKSKGERDVVIEEIKRSNDDIAHRKHDLMYAVTYPNQPQGRPVLGTQETLRAMTVQALSDYRDQYYVPNNVVFSAAGPIPHKDFLALIEKKFGHMPAVDFTPLPTARSKPGVAYVEMDSAKLCSTSLVAEGVAGTHPDRIAYEALGALLSGGGSSRFTKALVNKAALTNRADAGPVSYRSRGQFGVFLSTEAARTKEAIRIIYAEIHALTRNLTNAELNKVKAQLETAALDQRETNREACNVNGAHALVHGKVETAADIAAALKKLSVADVKRVARDFLNANPAFVAVIPTGTDRSLLPDYDDLLIARRDPALGQPARMTARKTPKAA